MEYIGVGARVNGVRPKTKKALREALTTDPTGVTFDRTSAFDGRGVISGDDVPMGVTLQVCGPDPHSKRNWYASVKLVDGAVTLT